MKLIIKGGTLEAELEGNPIEKIQSQLLQAIQKQDDDITAMGEHVNEAIVAVHKVNGLIAKQISDRSRQDITDLQASLNDAVAQMLARDQSNPEILALQEKVKKLSTLTKSEDARIKELRTKVGELSKRPAVKVKSKAKPAVRDEGISRLHSTVRRMGAVPISQYPRQSRPRAEKAVRTSIARAGEPVHSSDSDMQDKLGAKARMPI